MLPFSVLAPAKINLTLEVLGRRPDGFHALRSVMQTITLADRLTVEPAEALSLTCSDPHLDTPQNLVWRAAELLRRETGTAQGAGMRLQKSIPVAAGLGGGSSDAASALLALNRLWDLRLARGRLLELGARLGSDVPFFLGASACALVEGRGEVLSPLPDLSPRWVVLVRPPQPLSTAAVFGAFPPARWSDGARTSAWIAASAGGRHVPPPFNDLEPVALEMAPAARGARDALRAAGGETRALSGTGPTFFALFEGETRAREVYSRLSHDYQPGEATWLSRFGSPSIC